MAAFDEDARRVVAFLLRGEARIEQAARPDRILLDRGEGGKISVRAATLAELAQTGILERGPSTVRLSADYEGLTREGDALERRRELEPISVVSADGASMAAININESPLAQLSRRRHAGKPFLTDIEFRSGERLRADYTRAGIMPRLGANWMASVSSGRRGGAGGLVELTDAALAARQRVDNAIAAVGPELAGVLIDVCCFLKGMELVEAERRWPARSAKVLLKAGLGALSRHYYPASKEGNKPALHWGTADYKPTIDKS